MGCKKKKNLTIIEQQQQQLGNLYTHWINVEKKKKNKIKEGLGWV